MNADNKMFIPLGYIEDLRKKRKILHQRRIGGSEHEGGNDDVEEDHSQS